MRRLGVISEQQAGLPDPRHAQLLYPLQPLRCQNPHRPNVLMVVLESLRRDVLTPQLMPNTSALAQDARVFDRHFSTGNATRYGLFGLLYGLPGGYWQSMLDEQRGSQLFRCWASRATTCTCTAARRCTARNSIARHLPMCATSCTRALPP